MNWTYWRVGATYCNPTTSTSSPGQSPSVGPFPPYILFLINCFDFCPLGSLEYDEWSNHRQAWKLESSAIIEPPINFIVSSHSKGNRRWRVSLDFHSLHELCINSVAFKPQFSIPGQGGRLLTRHTCTVRGDPHNRLTIYSVQVEISLHRTIWFFWWMIF